MQWKTGRISNALDLGIHTTVVDLGGGKGALLRVIVRSEEFLSTAQK